MAQTDASALNSYDDITRRLDEIVEQVRDKDTSLERSLDLFDEAIELGSRAVEMVDDIHLTDEEAALLEAEEAEEGEATSGDEDAAETAEGPEVAAGDGAGADPASDASGDVSDEAATSDDAEV